MRFFLIDLLPIKSFENGRKSLSNHNVRNPKYLVFYILLHFTLPIGKLVDKIEEIIYYIQ
jgi:hypothetical protein